MEASSAREGRESARSAGASMSAADGVLVLERARVAQLLTLADCLGAVEAAFASAGRGAPHRFSALGAPVELGGFHVKVAVFASERPWFVAKTNANFPGNPERHGLPTIQGAILVFEADTGRLRAVMDTIEITRLRTAAATAVAARHLARPDSQVATICGCGEQGVVQLRALRSVLPIERAYAFDLQAGRAQRLAAEAADLGIEITPTSDLARATRASDVVVTCTTSHQYVLGPEAVRPGTFIAAVGADHPEKREIHPRLMAASKVVVDDLQQCAECGDLHHALESGDLTRDAVHAQLSELAAGRKRGRTSAEEITIFDSTGIALEDAASAVLVVERATARDDVASVRLGASP